VIILSSVVNNEEGKARKYQKAVWEKFKRMSEEGLKMIQMNVGIIERI